MPLFKLTFRRRPFRADVSPERREVDVEGVTLDAAHRKLRILLGDDRPAVRSDYEVSHKTAGLVSPFAPVAQDDVAVSGGKPARGRAQPL